MRYVFIVNPCSGKTNAMKSMAPQIAQAAEELGVKAEIVCTQHAGHATELAKQAAEQGDPVRLYAVGGDGTLNEVLAGAYPYANAAVGSIPCGSGNDLIRNFGEQAEFADIKAMLQGKEKIIDLLRVNDKICASVCCTGLDAKVAYDIPLFRRLPFCGGSAAYKLSIVENLFKPLGYALRVEADGKVFEGKFLIVTMCNGQYYGGGYHAAPEAAADDGMIDMVMVNKISRLRIPGVLKQYEKGKHITNGQVNEPFADIMQYIRAKKVTVTPLGYKPIAVVADGEASKEMRIEAEIMPLAARVIIPAGAE